MRKVCACCALVWIKIPENAKFLPCDCDEKPCTSNTCESYWWDCRCGTTLFLPKQNLDDIGPWENCPHKTEAA